MSHSFKIVLSVFFFSQTGLAQIQKQPLVEDPALRTKTVKSPSEDNRGVYAYGGSGIGLFQDIQVPVNEYEDTRGDGSVIAEENENHVGLPLYAGIGYRTHSGQVTYDLATIEGTQIRATSGPSATQSSSYTRLELFSAAQYNGFVLINAWVGLKGGIRRSFFNNISDSHFVESGILRGFLGFQGSTFGFSAFYGYAPYTRIGYTNEGFTGGEFFKKASAQVSEAGLTAIVKLKTSTFLDFGFEQEAIHMTIEDIMEYNGLGLNVTPSQQRTRDYNLSTVIVKAGFRKLF